MLFLWVGGPEAEGLWKGCVSYARAAFTVTVSHTLVGLRSVANMPIGGDSEFFCCLVKCFPGTAFNCILAIDLLVASCLSSHHFSPPYQSSNSFINRSHGHSRAA